MARVVLDTNVLVSALLKPAGLESRVLLLMLAGLIELYVSPEVLREYERVLPRRKFKLSQDAIDQTLAAIRGHSSSVSPTHRLSVSSDEADNRFLECAEAAAADYLITGNRRHFPPQWKQTSVVNAREFIEAIIVDLHQKRGGGATEDEELSSGALP